MARIDVDPGGLAATARALRDATTVAEEVHRGAHSLWTAAAATGSDRLADALGDFRSTWSYSLGLVVDDARTLASMLDQAARAYAQTDRSIGQACGR